LLHIEENQIYNMPNKKKKEEVDEKFGSNSDREQNINKFIDLNYDFNDFLQSVPHMGSPNLIQLMGHCHPSVK